MLEKHGYEWAEPMEVVSEKPMLDAICQQDKENLSEQIAREVKNMRYARRNLKYYCKVQRKSKRLYRDYALLKAVSQLNDDTLFYALREGIVVVKSPIRLQCVAGIGIDENHTV